MANYYNVAGYKHTGFNWNNRPLSREVLAYSPFIDEGNFFTMDGILTNRQDMFGLKHIDIQGSVKDYKGNQNNPANVIGSRPLGGPYYSIEEIDYIRIVRTGYPGDEDFVDIDQRILDPWNISHDGFKLFVGFYFVIGEPEPIARNVTRLYIKMDLWTTLNGAGELSIDSGLKVHGHITEAEDASSFNTCPEQVSIKEPLRVISSARVFSLDDRTVNVMVSGSALDQYTQEDAPTMDAVTAQAEGGREVVFPYINIARSTTFNMQYPTETQDVVMQGVGAYYPSDKVNYNVNLLYSAGQLELHDSYAIPFQYANFTRLDDWYERISGINTVVTSPILPDISGYPRKADYLFGEITIVAEATGDMNSQPFSNMNDYSIRIWSCPLPGGNPYAKFNGIKGVNYAYDQSVAGMAWISKSIALAGASGTFWNQVNNSFAQQSLDRSVAQNRINNNIQTSRFISRGAQSVANGVIGAGRIATSGVSLTNWAGGGKETFDAAQAISDAAFDAANLGIDVTADIFDRRFREQSLSQQQAQLNATIAQTTFQRPSVQFVPTIGSGAFAINTFSVYITNTSAADREYLRTKFRMFGYSLPPRQLTYEEINVKQRVNFIMAENASFSHTYYPARVTSELSELFAQGFFLWSEKPNYEAFSNNPDN